MKNILFIFIVFLLSPISVYSEEHSLNKKCLGKLDIETIILCTLDHSPEYKIAKWELEAGWGRRRVAEYFFPSNPVVSGATSNRRAAAEGFFNTGTQSVINGEILFSQEIYTGGKRDLKINLADTELKSLLKKIQAVERLTIHQAIVATIQYQTSREEYLLSEDLYLLGEMIQEVAKVRFQNGLGTEMDWDLAKAELLQLKSMREESRRKKDSSLADLVVMMGIPFAGREDLIPREIPMGTIKFKNFEDFISEAERNRPDLEALEYEIRLAESRIRLLQKDRIPNVTFSGFVQNDGFNERVIGARVSIPLPIARDFSGEIREAKAIEKKQIAIREVGEHTVRQEAIKAWNNHKSWKTSWLNYSPETMDKSLENLRILSQAVERGDISVRDAILLQRPFIQLKKTYFQTKSGYALSIAEYLRAGGIHYSEYLKREKNEL